MSEPIRTLSELRAGLPLLAAALSAPSPTVAPEHKL